MALMMYTDIIRLAPSHTAYSNRSACYCAAREYPQAFADACKCIDMMPTWFKGYSRKGAALHGMDRWSEAIKVFDEGLKMEPGNRLLQQARQDAEKRLAIAGGEWQWIGTRKVLDEQGYEENLLKQPALLAPGPNGGICVLDRGRSMVRIMNADASYISCSLNGDQQINREGLFGEVHGLACDGAQYVYATDGMRCRVIKCDVVSGKLLKAQGRSGCEKGNFEEPWGLALADTSALHGGVADSTLFVADAKNHRITALDASDLSFRFHFGTWGYGEGEFIEPHGLAAHGNMLAVADHGNQRVCLFSLDGTFLRSIGAQGVGSRFEYKVEHVALTDGHLFVLEELQRAADSKVPSTQGSKVYVIDPQTGALRRPPLVPPFALNNKSKGVLSGIGVFNDNLYVSTGYGCVLALSRKERK